jgi:hypothetical protein
VALEVLLMEETLTSSDVSINSTLELPPSRMAATISSMLSSSTCAPSSPASMSCDCD